MINTYFFTHWLESEEILVECCARSFGQAIQRLSKALGGANFHYHGWISGTMPQIHIAEISQRQDPICKDYPYQSTDQLQ